MADIRVLGPVRAGARYRQRSCPVRPRAATELDPTAHSTSLSVLVAYTQATATDLLRALGIDREPARERVARTARTVVDPAADMAVR
jgi:hypothetical protein